MVRNIFRAPRDTTWNAETKRYRDYNVRTDTQNDDHFATTFAPLWVGLAADSQAAATAENLWQLEAPAVFSPARAGRATSGTPPSAGLRSR